jgi:hypothetical protein
MLELLSLIIGATQSAVHGRKDLILENLLLRQQLQVALRPRRRRRVTGFSGFWSGVSFQTGVGTFYMCGPKRSFAGIGAAGGGI